MHIPSCCPVHVVNILQLLALQIYWHSLYNTETLSVNQDNSPWCKLLQEWIIEALVWIPHTINQTVTFFALISGLYQWDGYIYIRPPSVLCNTFGRFLVTFFMFVFVHWDWRVRRRKAGRVAFLTFTFEFRAALKAII